MERPSRKIFEDGRPSRMATNMDGSQESVDNSNVDSSRRVNRSISPISSNQQDQSFETSDILKPMLLVDIDNKGMMKINRKAIEYLQTIKKNVRWTSCTHFSVQIYFSPVLNCVLYRNSLACSPSSSRTVSYRKVVPHEPLRGLSEGF